MVAGAGMTGLAVRVSKGMHHNFAVEGEIVGGRSGEVSFSDVSWRGMTGDVTRRASFGRVQGAGVLRFGYDVVLTTRLGIGVQISDYTSNMASNGAKVAGPGDGFEVDGVFAVGLGVDARVGESWTIGAGAAFAAGFGFETEMRSLEGGVHAGYHWSVAP